MKALVCNEYAPWHKLRLEDAEAPSPSKDEVLIDIKAAGINFPDLLTIEGKYQVKPPLPFIPGVEAAGVVAAVGQGVSGFAVGDRIIASLQGAFAEQGVASVAAAYPMGNTLSFEQAAGLTIVYGTSYYALKQRAQLQPGETVLVLGAAGGVGIATVQLAKAMGATVIAAASSAEKLDFARDAGADLCINYVEEDLKSRAKALTHGNGADVIYDPVGGEFSEAAFRAIAWNGRFLVIGFAAGPIPKMPLNLALLKGASLVGVFWGAWASRFPAESQENFRELIEMVDSSRITPPVTEVYALRDYADAFRCIAERRARGKVILTMS